MPQRRIHFVVVCKKRIQTKKEKQKIVMARRREEKSLQSLSLVAVTIYSWRFFRCQISEFTC